MKTLKLKIPDWVDESMVKYHVKEMVELEKKRKKILKRIISKLNLNEKDLEEFEEFRADLWKKEWKKYFSL